MDAVFFAGGNTFEGFQGLYGELLAHSRRAVVLKGGPGVGKSTLMRKIAKQWEDAGDQVEYYLCSGDPDSVDAVRSPERGLLVLDGTAPHIVDPVLPGARHSIINLGECLNERKLHARVNTIENLQKEISDCYARAYRLLYAAHAMRKASMELLREALDVTQARREFTRLFERAVWTEGEVRTRFAEAITCQGVLRRLHSALGAQVVSLEAPWGFDLGMVLKPLIGHARHMGYAADVYCDPLDISAPAHVNIGGVAFSGADGNERVELPLLPSRLAACRNELDFDHAVYDLLLNRAIDALAEAKLIHDELECVYTSAMNYDIWDACYARAASMMAESGSSATEQPAKASVSAV